MSIAAIGWKSSRGLHRTVHEGTALGDVGTVADLFATVLRQIAEQRGLATWEQLAAYAAEEWVPSRIAFGQHKGRSIGEARTDAGLCRWLDGLAQFANARNARMGRWYLRSLEEAAEPSLFVAWECARDPAAVAVTSTSLVLYVNRSCRRLLALMDAAQVRLVEAGKPPRRAGSGGSWRKLFYPDRFAHEPEKQETYHKLTAAINHAKDHGDLATSFHGRPWLIDVCFLDQRCTRAEPPLAKAFT